MSENENSHIKWTPEEEVKLETLCGQVKYWFELESVYESFKADFQNRSWDAARRKINRNKDWIKHFVDISQQDIVDYLARMRTVDEIGKKFKISKEEASKLLEKEYKGYRLISQFNVHNERTFLLLPKDPIEINVKKRIWTPHLQKDGQPYIIIEFPANLKWQKVKIVPISDVIFGSSHHNGELFDEYVNWISRSPNVFIFFNGDIIAYLKNLELLKENMTNFKYKISRIAHKILWAQQGDEERRSKRIHQGFDSLKVICKDLNIPYFEEPIYADVLWEDVIFSFYCIHGFTGAQTKGGKINAAIRSLDFQEHIMFTVMSHAQDSITKENIRICRDTVNFDLLEKRQHVIVCPTFSKYFGTERAIKGYPPPSSGSVSCNLEPKKKDYYISI